MRKVFRPSSLLRLISSRNDSKRTRSRILSGVFKQQYPVTSNLQFIGKPILKALPVHTTFYLCDHAGADKKKAKNSTDNDQGSSSNELEAFYLGRSRSLRVDRLVYLLSQVVALDYWQDTIKAAHDFGGFRLTANEEKKGRAVYCIDYDVACSMVEQLEENVYQCRSFTEDILFYEMDTKEGYLKNCSCPDQTKMYKHIFLVSRVTKLPFSPRASAPVAQQERFSTPNEGQGLFCREI
ncbi:hypothetical protein BCV71DRAFT_273978 [Rhizopus microsporus]|uniref:SWIM-type domain-containing protein n=1 Tax=Rhizopus microsporus TaxID=58291 RepID=A0A1X0SBZ0_RHIZD|nr:hypothetical protein BCV71DRAFT_273978 [Rhizopus microsporus]